MAQSTNAINGRVYEIPSVLNDRSNIEQFIAKNQNKPVVVVQGLGFVGAVMSLVCANAINGDYAVIGVDLPNSQTYWKIQSLNEGAFPLVAEDPKIEEHYQKSRDKGNFYATYDEYAYSLAEVIIVDINLDVKKNSNKDKDIESYEVEFSGFKKAMESIGRNCKPNVLVLVETTVPPGTCEKVVYPILKENLSKRGLPTDKFHLGHSYERVMPGPTYYDSIQNFYRVFSGIDEASANTTEKFLRTIIRTDQYPLTRLGNTNATEMAKVLENSFRAMNIAFIVEWSRFAEEAGVDIYEVVNAIRMRSTHANIMLPGMGVGGYCLTKDPLLASWARQNLIGGKERLSFSEAGVGTNDKMPIYAFNYMKSQVQNGLRGKKILLLGVSYRSEVGDTRYTPVETFYNLCIESGMNVLLHDPYVNYWEETKQNVSSDFNKMLFENPDLIVISTGHKFYFSAEGIDAIMKLEKTFLYDTIGIWKNDVISKLKSRHVVKVLGRGDL